MLICVIADMCVCMYVRMYVCMYTHTHICTYTRWYELMLDENAELEKPEKYQRKVLVSLYEAKGLMPGFKRMDVDPYIVITLESRYVCVRGCVRAYACVYVCMSMIWLDLNVWMLIHT